MAADNQTISKAIASAVKRQASILWLEIDRTSAESYSSVHSYCIRGMSVAVAEQPCSHKRPGYKSDVEWDTSFAEKCYRYLWERHNAMATATWKGADCTGE
jgi:hypothetical protein